jgi:methylmalonyl-CoA mutase cobalamin-binding domain/chain
VTGNKRPGRIVIGTLGLDQHEVGAMAISQFLVRQGYEVIYLGRFNTPERLAAVAEQEDADLIGVSVHSWEFLAYADELVARCRDLGIGLVLGGSVLTDRDQADLIARGADAVFGPYASEAAMLHQIDAIAHRVRAGDAAPHPFGTKDAGLPGPLLAGPLAGRVVIVTGAARGLGRAYTLELCRQGAAVVATDVDEAALKEMADAVRDVPGSVHAQACDITDPDAPRLLLRTALRRYGQLHGLVSNAGLLRSGPILRLDDDDLRLLLDIHVTAAFRLLRVIGGYWRAEARAGRAIDAAVVLTTSSAGLYGFRAEAAYRGPGRRPPGRRERRAGDRLAARAGRAGRHWPGPGGRERPDLGARHLAARHAVPAADAHVPRGGGRPAAPRPRQRHTITSAAHLTARSNRA